MERNGILRQFHYSHEQSAEDRYEHPDNSLPKRTCSGWLS